MQTTSTLLLSSFPLWTIVKIFYLIGIGVYVIFALVIIRQTQIMTDTVKLKLEGLIKLLAVAHFIFAVLVFAFAFITL